MRHFCFVFKSCYITVLIVINSFVFKFWPVIIERILANDKLVIDKCVYLNCKYSTHYTSGVSRNSNASQKFWYMHVILTKAFSLSWWDMINYQYLLLFSAKWGTVFLWQEQTQTGERCVIFSALLIKDVPS